MQTSVIERTAFVAEYQARAALRAGRQGDQPAMDRHKAVMNAVIAGSKFPVSLAKGLVQLIGRGRAMVLGVPKRMIHAALSPSAPVLACHYLAPARPLVRFDRFELAHVEVVDDRVGLWDMGELRAVIRGEVDVAALESLIGTMIDVEFDGDGVVAVREV